MKSSNLVQNYIAVTSADVGDCKDGKLLTCSTPWTGGYCRWDCKQVSTLKQASEVDDQTFLTFANKVDPTLKGCHYGCWKGCVTCGSNGNKYFVFLVYRSRQLSKIEIEI